MSVVICEQIIEAELIIEAIRRAESAGFFPACAQRAIDWEMVRAWAIRVRQHGFQWGRPDDQNLDAIIIGPGKNGGLAIHAGQHRILGGLLGGNPVPLDCMTFLDVTDYTRGWQEEPGLLDLLEILRH
jgi:hypothetical protein